MEIQEKLLVETSPEQVMCKMALKKYRQVREKLINQAIK